MNGHQESKKVGFIRAGLEETANDFNLSFTDCDKSVKISDGKNTIEMFYKQGTSEYQGLYSLNGGPKLPYYNSRACIIIQLNINIQYS